MKVRKPGTLADNHIAVVDRNGFIRGYVHSKATGATASRFTNNLNMRLGKHEGRMAWLEQDDSAPRPQPRRVESANHKSARGSVRAR